GNRAGRDLGARVDEAAAVARELGIEAGELQAETGRLGMDAVAAADHRRHLVFARAALQRLEQRVDIGEEDVARLRKLDRETGIEHVARGQALMDEARLGPDMLGDVGEKGDDVVPRLALDLVDARDLEFAALAQRLRRAFRHHAGLRQCFGGGDLDVEPDAEPVLRRPNGAHLRPGITGDHRRVGSAGSAVLPRVKDMRTSSTRIKAYYKTIRSAR